MSYRKKSDEISVREREDLMAKLLANEKILTLIYDKTFYSGNKLPQDIEMPTDLKKILEDDVEGFD